MTKGPNNQGEYEYDPTAAGNATIGGPNGAGGVYSSKPGCFAPCYWEYDGSGQRPNGPDSMTSNNRLRYFDDNRAPVIRQVRLGVNYFRASSTASIINRPGQSWHHTDINWGTTIYRDTTPLEPINRHKDGKPFIIARNRTNRGSPRFPGTHPIPDLVLADGVPYIFIPNFYTFEGTGDPSVPTGDLTLRYNNRNWRDENWEYRADPINRACTIADVTRANEIVCSSEWQNCSDAP